MVFILLGVGLFFLYRGFDDCRPGSIHDWFACERKGGLARV